MPIPKPSYTIWQAISAALALATRALNEVRALARMPGPTGEKGEKGEPGLGFDDLTYDGERRFTYKRFDDERVFVVPFMIYRGLWSRDQAYERGDCITSDGGIWHAETNTIAGIDRPGISKAWKLAVKRGRDGKSA